MPHWLLFCFIILNEGITFESYVKVVAAKPIFSALYDFRRHSQRLPATSALTRGTPSQKQC